MKAHKILLAFAAGLTLAACAANTNSESQVAIPGGTRYVRTSTAPTGISLWYQANGTLKVDCMPKCNPVAPKGGDHEK